MDYTFVINGDSSSRKRRAPQGACEVCKKRKKRCTHGVPSSSSNQEHQVHHPTSDAGVSDLSESHVLRDVSTVLEEPIAPGSERQNATQSHDPPSVSRFIGDSNPEATLVAEQGPGSSRRDRDDVGMWVGEPVRQHVDAAHERGQSWNRIENLSPPDTENTILLLPNKRDRDALIDVYFSKVNVLLPILHVDAFQSPDDQSPAIIQAICLVASKDPIAENHLRFAGDQRLLTRSEFSSRLYSSLKRGIQLQHERDKIILIQTLALMSLHSEGPDGAEEASMNLSQAIHHEQTIGLHMGRSTEHGGSQIRLCWALWCLSNLNAALNGRPRLMIDRDIGLKIEEAYSLFGPATRVLLTISQILSRVIDVYQPAALPDVFGVEEDFDSFENIMERCQAWDIEPTIMTTLELYYHGVAIISHRARNSTESIQPAPTPSSLRRELSALQIVTILRQISAWSLTPLPLVSYAISLAMSSFYSQLRRARYATKRAAAREHLESCVQALEQLGEWSWPAQNMAKIGRKALRQTAQVAAAASPDDLRRGSRVGVERAAAGWQPIESQDRFGSNHSDALEHGGITATEQQQGQVDGDTSGFNIAYDGLMDMDAVFGDFLTMNLPDFGLPFQ